MDESEEQIREVHKEVRDLDRTAGDMEKRSDKLDSEIDTVRQEFQRKRNDEGVPGLPPEPEAARDTPGDTQPEGQDSSESPPAEEATGDSD